MYSKINFNDRDSRLYLNSVTVVVSHLLDATTQHQANFILFGFGIAALFALT